MEKVKEQIGVNHQDFRPPHRDSKFSLHDCFVEIDDTFAYREYMDEFILYATNMKETDLERERLLWTVRGFNHLIKKGHKSVSESFVRLVVDYNLWKGTFNRIPAQERPIFPWEKPVLKEHDYDKDDNEKEVQTACAAYESWKMYLKLEFFEKELRVPDFHTLSEQSKARNLKEGQDILDKCGYRSTYQVRRASERLLAPRTRLDERMGTNPQVYSKESAPKLGVPIENPPGDKEAHVAAALAQLWKNLGWGRWESENFVTGPFEVAIPKEVADLGVVDNFLDKDNIVLTRPLDQGRIIVARRPDRTLVRLRVSLSHEALTYREEDRAIILSVWKCIFMFAVAVWSGVPVPLSFWHLAWHYNLYPIIRAYENWDVMYMGARYVQQIAEEKSGERINKLIQERKSAVEAFEQLQSTMSNFTSLDHDKIIKEVKVWVRGNREPPYYAWEFGHYYHCSLLALVYMGFDAGSKIKHGEEGALNLAKALSLELLGDAEV